MKKILGLLFCIGCTVISYGQEVKTTTTSVVKGESAFFIKGKFVPKVALEKIKREQIKSVNVIQRDTIINEKKYAAQIFVVLHDEK